MFVYLIVNHISGKYYVGQHSKHDLKKYLKSKIRHAQSGKRQQKQSYLQSSMRKHDPSVWSIHALISDVNFKEELDRLGIDFIEFLKARNPQYGYNHCIGGEGFTGKHSLETKAKITAASKAMWMRPEIRENFSRKMLGRPCPLVVRKAVAKAHLGKIASPVTLKRLSDSHVGKTRDEASRKKQSASISGVKNHFFGKKHSEATLIKLREKRMQNLQKLPMPSSLKVLQGLA